jgi:choline dehydrogenase-like flavoprotein
VLTKADLARSGWIDDLKVTNLSDHGAGGSNVGCAFIPTNLDPVNATRSTSRTGYYDPVSSRANLQLLVRHYVPTVVFENKTAVGVNMVSRSDKKTAVVRARKEVILAAGAIQTPKILQLSGIGPTKLLESLDIGVVEHLPGVGANFQDHPNVAVRYTCECSGSTANI